MYLLGTFLIAALPKGSHIGLGSFQPIIYDFFFNKINQVGNTSLLIYSDYCRSIGLKKIN